jgi:hypothetical protein
MPLSLVFGAIDYRRGSSLVADGAVSIPLPLTARSRRTTQCSIQTWGLPIERAGSTLDAKKKACVAPLGPEPPDEARRPRRKEQTRLSLGGDHELERPLLERCVLERALDLIGATRVSPPVISRRAAQHQDLRRAQHRCAVARSQPLAGTTRHRASGYVARSPLALCFRKSIDRVAAHTATTVQKQPRWRSRRRFSARTTKVSRPVNVRWPDLPISCPGRYG